VTPVGEIERELEALWRVVPGREDPEHPVIRACMSNLLVLCRSEAEAGTVMAELPEILALHPARSLVLIADQSATAAELEAYVAAHCHMREGAQICGESVTVTARGGATSRLAAVARSLLVGDLPTTLWWATPEAPALGGNLFTDLAAMTNQVVFDSLGWLEPVRGMTAMGKLRSDRPLLTDVCWRRLKGWRRILSQGLDPAFAPGVIAGAGELEIEHGPHALTQAWLLVGWLACRLGWQAEGGKVAPGIAVTWRFRGPAGPLAVTVKRLPEGPPEILTIRLGPAPGRSAPRLRFENRGAGRLAVSVEESGGGIRAVAIPLGTRASLVARQLSDLAPDALFRDTLAVACGMAASLPH